MNRRFLAEAATLIAAALLCALVSNALAGRERKLALKGDYPNALKVPQETAPAPLPVVSAAPAASQTTTVAQTATVAQTTTVPPTTTRAGEAAGAPLSTATMPPAKTTTAAPVKAAPPTTDNRQPTTTPKPDTSRFQAHPDKAYLEIAYGDVAALHAAGALFLDARRTSVYEQGHIAGARPFSVWESDIDQKVNKLFDERSDPREQALPIVVYCSGGECEDSHMLAQKLWGIQFNNVYVYKDGFPDWQQRGGTVHTGANP
jgi:rhodanese-related sulfurtransferase